MIKTALILFYKNPVSGRVKTRLAATLGAARALEIYILLVQHTHRITTKLDVEKFVFYSDAIEQDDIWQHGDFKKLVQRGDDFGLRMQQAFQHVFQIGFQKAVIIGCDCMQLTQQDIEEAFCLLDEKDVVLGPAEDGGYYLLGMKRLHEQLFQNKQWSTERVFEETISDVRNANLENGLLKKLTDVDEEKDLWTLSSNAVL